jgi:hypothetical protein
MEIPNLPRHVIETFEKRWAQKLHQEAAAGQGTRPPIRSRTEFGTALERRPRRPRVAAAQASVP